MSGEEESVLFQIEEEVSFTEFGRRTREKLRGDCSFEDEAHSRLF